MLSEDLISRAAGLAAAAAAAGAMLVLARPGEPQAAMGSSSSMDVVVVQEGAGESAASQKPDDASLEQKAPEPEVQPSPKQDDPKKALEPKPKPRAEPPKPAHASAPKTERERPDPEQVHRQKSEISNPKPEPLKEAQDKTQMKPNQKPKPKDRQKPRPPDAREQKGAKPDDANGKKEASSAVPKPKPKARRDDQARRQDQAPKPAARQDELPRTLREKTRPAPSQNPAPQPSADSSAMPQAFKAQQGRTPGLGAGVPHSREREMAGRVRAELARSLIYPRAASRRGIEGRVMVRFEIRGGRVVSSSVASGSGSPILDEAARKLAASITGFKVGEEGDLGLEVPIEYRLF